MQRQSEEILDLLNSSEEVESSLAIHGDRIGRLLDERFAPRFPSLEEGDPRPGFPATLSTFRSELAHSRGLLEFAEQLHRQRLMEMIALRAQREELVTTVYGDFSALRHTLDDVYGAGVAAELAGITGPTAQRPYRLLRQCESAIRHLLRPDLEVPEPRFERVQADPADMAGQLEPKARRLREVLTELRETRRAAQDARKDKAQAVANHKETFLWIARAAESYYRLAGEKELAERIRPSDRRPGRREAEVEPSPDDDQPEGDDAAAAPAADAEKPEGTAAETPKAQASPEPAATESPTAG